MRRLLLSLLALVAAGTAAGATTPALVPIRSYYGPIRICTPLFAFDVRAGEGYLHTGPGHVVRFGHHNFTFGEPWHLDGPQFSDFVRPMGTLDVPGIGRLERVELTARNHGGPNIVYLYDTGFRGPGRKVQIRSDLFDGSDGDVARFDRLAGGDRRTAMCADVPEALRPRPEREDSDAFWVSPERAAGPLTLCWSGLALDVRAGEAVIPFWYRGWGLLGVATGNRRVTISGSFASLRDASGQPFRGPLAARPEFEILEDNAQPGIPPPLRAAGGIPPRRVRLFRAAEGAASGRRPYGGIGFAFSGPASSAEVAAFVGRLRPRAASDICFGERS